MRAFILALLLLSFPAHALSFKTGEVLGHTLSICLDKKDAVSIVEAHKQGGMEAAEAAWNKNDKCGNVVIQGPTVGKVVHSAPVDMGGKKVTASVVQILGDDGAVLGYFITTSPVNTDRNS
jgi:hypothetical protein